MLQNGLGELILGRARHHDRIVDLFCGGGSVAWFAAEFSGLPVLAIDLQAYAVSMARAVVSRTTALRPQALVFTWLDQVVRIRNHSPRWKEARRLEAAVQDVHQLVASSRELCRQESRIGPLWNAYGGHYFSPTQAITLDYMLKYLPSDELERSTCLAAAITCASQCSASPGHTAQPFQPTQGASPFILEAWEKDPINVAERALSDICLRRAVVVGEARVGEAVSVAQTLEPTDLVVVDPPYSGVQYSRFYHVLETMTQRDVATVSGVGRYPPLEHRPQSSFSKKSESVNALSLLLAALASTGATVIFTFPAGDCSNGLSGGMVLTEAKKWFNVEEAYVDGTFSTLGGNNNLRASRARSRELLLVLSP